MRGHATLYTTLGPHSSRMETATVNGSLTPAPTSIEERLLFQATQHASLDLDIDGRSNKKELDYIIV